MTLIYRFDCRITGEREEIAVCKYHSHAMPKVNDYTVKSYDDPMTSRDCAFCLLGQRSDLDHLRIGGDEYIEDLVEIIDLKTRVE